MATVSLEGKSAMFDSFVKFANEQIRAGNKSGIARGAMLMTKNRDIELATTDTARGLGSLFRSKTDFKANNITRAAFKNALMTVLHSFGIDDVPPKVLAELKSEDFGKGKPLTARRIGKVVGALQQHVDAVQAQKDAAAAAAAEAAAKEKAKANEVPLVTKRVPTAKPGVGTLRKDTCDAIKSGNFYKGLKHMEMTFGQIHDSFAVNHPRPDGFHCTPIVRLYGDLAVECRNLRDGISGMAPRSKAEGAQNTLEMVGKIKALFRKEAAAMEEATAPLRIQHDLSAGGNETLKVGELMEKIDINAENSRNVDFYQKRVDQAQLHSRDVLNALSEVALRAENTLMELE